jgi:hypothetical protein
LRVENQKPHRAEPTGSHSRWGSEPLEAAHLGFNVRDLFGPVAFGEHGIMIKFAVYHETPPVVLITVQNVATGRALLLLFLLDFFGILPVAVLGLKPPDGLFVPFDAPEQNIVRIAFVILDG